MVITNALWANYDFSDVCSSGQTLYYDIISDTSVRVSYPECAYYYNEKYTCYDADYYYGYAKPTGNLIIPASVTYNGKTYTVTRIGNFAFNECTELTSVTIPNSVTRIGMYAFNGCTELTSVTIGSGVTSIGGMAFCGCTGLTTVNFNAENCTEMGSFDERVFYGCSNIKTLTIGENVKTIPVEAFKYCSELTSVTIPNSVTSIGQEAFRDCTGLITVTIGNGVTSIGEWAFVGCTGLTGTLTIPNSVTSIGEGAFSGCSGLTSITIPPSVTSIRGDAFAGCTGLTSVTIPNSVTSIGEQAFYKCSGLTSFTIPNSVTSIGEQAFDNTGWWNAQTSQNIISIYKDGWCLREYNGSIKNGTKGIAGIGFAYNCVVIIPNSVTNISFGEDVNWGKEINVATDNPNYTSIDGILYDKDTTTLIKCPKGKTGNVIVPNSVTSIGQEAFSGCTGLTTVTIGNGVTSIGQGAFQYCHGLTSITIPNSVTSIGQGAFNCCTGLTTVTIGNGVTSIGEWAFNYCYGLTTVTIGNGVTSIGEWAFSDCIGLTSITIPNSVTSIGDCAFSGCTELTTVTIGNGVTSIGEYAFQLCPRLTFFTIPNSVTSIGYNAFYSTGWWNNQPDGIIYKDGWCLGYKGSKPTGTLSIQEGTKRILSVSHHNVVIIPNSVTYVERKAFYNAEDSLLLICLATIPPAVNGPFFRWWKDGKLFVPDESIYQYKYHQVWGDFKIFPISEAPAYIKEIIKTTYNVNAIAEANSSNAQIFGGEKRIVINNAANATVAIYDVMGRTVVKEQRINTDNEVFAVPQRGMYIVRIGKAAKKVWVR